MGYEVINEGTETLIKGTELVVRVHTGPANDGLAYGLGHLYQVKGGFVPVRTYVFEVTDLAEVTVEAVKKIIDFFFRFCWIRSGTLRKFRPVRCCVHRKRGVYTER